MLITYAAPRLAPPASPRTPGRRRRRRRLLRSRSRPRARSVRSAPRRHDAPRCRHPRGRAPPRAQGERARPRRALKGRRRGWGGRGGCVLKEATRGGGALKGLRGVRGRSGTGGVSTWCAGTGRARGAAGRGGGSARCRVKPGGAAPGAPPQRRRFAELRSRVAFRNGRGGAGWNGRCFGAPRRATYAFNKLINESAPAPHPQPALTPR